MPDLDFLIQADKSNILKNIFSLFFFKFCQNDNYYTSSSDCEVCVLVLMGVLSDHTLHT